MQANGVDETAQETARTNVVHGDQIKIIYVFVLKVDAQFADHFAGLDRGDSRRHVLKLRCKAT